MIRLKKNKLIIILMMLIVAAGCGTYSLLKPKRLNILILSTCSLSANRLGFYNPQFSPFTSNIDAVAKKSFVFQNAITDMSWSNVSGYLSTIPLKHLEDNGYTAIGRPWTEEEIEWQHIKTSNPVPYYMRIPNFLRSQRNAPTSYSQDLIDIKAKLKNRKHWPFMLEVHNKVVHLPYMKVFERKNPVIRMMPKESREYVIDYQQNYKSQPDRIPFGLYVLERGKETTEGVISTLQLKGDMAQQLRDAYISPTFVGLLNNPHILEKWQKTKHFKKDFEIIKESYDYMVKFYDNSIADLLKLYDDKELEKNTVIIFTGDHGEAFLEHGYLVHGETVYDEMIRFPLFVKFPGQTESKQIKSQFYQQGIASLVEKIIAGEINKDNFEKYILEENNHPLIYSRNCSNNIKSLRYKNEWKLIWDKKKDQKLLFNLISDPAEKSDVYFDRQDIATLLEDSFEEIVNKQAKNKMLHECTPENE